MFIMETAIREAIQGVLKKLGIEPVDFAVEHPADLSHGDYATNVAMALSKRLGKNPRELAEQFCTELGGVLPEVAAIEIAGPGFINFRLKRDYFAKEIAAIREVGDAWGKNKALKGAEILFEYTSPNLFKPLHVGNLVGNILGESVSRLMEFSGATVKRINYPSDIGLTVAKGVWGLTHIQGDPADINQIGEAYRAGNDAYENDSAAKIEIEAVNRALYARDNQDLNALRSAGIKTSKSHLTALCKKLGTVFDFEIYESDASPTGVWTVREHLGEVFEESDGATIYRGEKHGLHTRVFLNSQGLPTYEAKDLGNFVLKQKQYPSWTHYFVVTGSEQREYFKVLFAALRDIFPEAATRKLEHIATGFLTLTTGKMSSRKGNVLTGESLIADVEAAAQEKAKGTRSDDINALGEMIAVGALKYQILRQATGSDIVFDKERALSFEGDSGPYLQYTHARIISVLEKAKEAGVVMSADYAPVAAYPIEKILYRFEEMIHEALVARAPHLVTTYLTELAGAFNTFYAGERIADATDEYAPYKAAVADAVRITLKNGLWTLGIKAPLKM